MRELAAMKPVVYGAAIGAMLTLVVGIAHLIVDFELPAIDMALFWGVGVASNFVGVDAPHFERNLLLLGGVISLMANTAIGAGIGAVVGSIHALGK